jgi:hypothetical protein
VVVRDLILEVMEVVVVQLIMLAVMALKLMVPPEDLQLQVVMP